MRCHALSVSHIHTSTFFVLPFLFFFAYPLLPHLSMLLVALPAAAHPTSRFSTFLSMPSLAPEALTAPFSAPGVCVSSRITITSSCTYITVCVCPSIFNSAGVHIFSRAGSHDSTALTSAFVSSPMTTPKPSCALTPVSTPVPLLTTAATSAPDSGLRFMAISAMFICTCTYIFTGYCIQVYWCKKSNCEQVVASRGNTRALTFWKAPNLQFLSEDRNQYFSNWTKPEVDWWHVQNRDLRSGSKLQETRLENIDLVGKAHRQIEIMVVIYTCSAGNRHWI